MAHDDTQKIASRQPLKINYDELFDIDDDEPVASIVVVSSADYRKRNSDNELSQMSDIDLKDKIGRLRVRIPKLRLTLNDNNAEKLEIDLKRFEDEFKFRRVQFRRKLADGGKNPLQERRNFNGDSEILKQALQSSDTTDSSQFGRCLMKKLENSAKPGLEQNTRDIPRNAFQDEMSFMSQCGNQKRNAGGYLTRFKKAKPELSSKDFYGNIKSGPASKDFLGSKHSNDAQSREKYGGLNGNLARRPSTHDKPPDSLTFKFKGLRSKSANGDKLKEEHNIVLVDEEEPQLIEKIQEADLHCSRSDCKIYYPSREDPDSIEIYCSQLKCLGPGECLTSTIMNFYIRFLRKMYFGGDESKQKFYFFNTYLYIKLQDAVSRQKEAFFTKFRRWWKGVNIFEKKYIFLPINEHKHWSLVIICISNNEDSRPLILHLDSLGLHCSSSIFDNVKSLLGNEWKYLIEDGGAVDTPITDTIMGNLPERIDCKTIAVPQQTNDYDCGLFVLYYIERFIQDAPEQMEEKHLAKFGKKWFKPQEASSLRGRIKNILVEEFEKAAPREDKSPSKPTSIFADAETTKTLHWIDVS